MPVPGDDDIDLLATLASAAVTGESVTPRVRVSSGAGAKPYAQLTEVDQRHYVVGPELARGGMGRISVALDRRLDRQVAIKELLATDAGARARFEREARITARLEHPAIVSVHEAGTWPSGEPFYAMKLVSGQPLETAVARCTSFVDRLGLLPNVLAAVDALAYAHSYRVIHRDLKPANILVGEFGETVVIDWGLAKDLANETTDVHGTAERGHEGTAADTVDGAVMGTPAYMPPEQASGAAVDERADVYSLGAVLYECLSGSPPFFGTTTADILMKVLSGSRRPLSELVPELPLDLVAIVERAMSFEPANRYASAKDLADELKRFQTGQLVGAHSYSSWQLFTRWVRRHRTAVAVGGVALAVLGVGGAISVNRILDAQAATERQHAEAERHRERAEGLVEFMVGDMSDKLEPVGKLPLLNDVASRARDYYNDVPPAGLIDELPRTAVRIRIGDVLLQQNQLAGALDEYDGALTTRAALYAAWPNDPAIADAVAEAYSKVGSVSRALGETNRALAEQGTCSMILSRQPPTPARRDALADCRGAEAFLLGDAGDIAASLALLREVRAERADLVRTAPSVSAYRYGLALAHARFATYAQLVDTTEAMAAARAANDLERELMVQEPGNTAYRRATVQSSLLLARMQAQTGDATGAVASAREAVMLAEELSGMDPTNADWQDLVVSAHDAAAQGAVSAADLPTALAAYAMAAERAETVLARDPANALLKTHLAQVLTSWALTLKSDGQLDAAFAQARRARALREELLAAAATPATRGGLSVTLDALTSLYTETEDLPAALATASQSLELMKQVLDSDPTAMSYQHDLAKSYLVVAGLEKYLEQTASATTHARDALSHFRVVTKQEPSLVSARVGAVAAAQLLASLLTGTGRVAESLVVIEEAAEQARALYALDSTQLLHVMTEVMAEIELGDALVANDDVVRAERAYEDGLAATVQLIALTARNPGLGESAEGLATELRQKLKDLRPSK